MTWFVLPWKNPITPNTINIIKNQIKYSEAEWICVLLRQSLPVLWFSLIKLFACWSCSCSSQLLGSSKCFICYFQKLKIKSSFICENCILKFFWIKFYTSFYVRLVSAEYSMTLRFQVLLKFYFWISCLIMSLSHVSSILSFLLFPLLHNLQTQNVGFLCCYCKWLPLTRECVVYWHNDWLKESSRTFVCKSWWIS